jgi:hypothetical protein
MTMVGLFWITEDSVHIGAEPVGEGTGVRLTEDGVRTLGIEQGRTWAWHQVHHIAVSDVPVRSAARRLAAMAFGALFVALTGDGELPPVYTVHLTTDDGVAEVSVAATVTGGMYTPAEHAMSCALLERLADGRTPVGELLAWRRGRAGGATPGREEREALLRRWTGGAQR